MIGNIGHLGMVSSYNIYTSPSQGPTGWGASGNLGVTGPELGAYYAKQAMYAAAGTALASMDAEPHPPDELTGAANTAGAYWRVAYWLATGVRILNGQGAPFNRRRELLFKAAAANASASGRLGMAYNPLTWIFSGNETPEDVQRVFEDGAKTAEGYGLPQIAARLRQLGTKKATTAQQAATAGQQPLTDLPANISGGWFQSWKPVVGVGFAFLVLAAVVAWKNRKAIGSAGKAAAFLVL